MNRSYTAELRDHLGGIDTHGKAPSVKKEHLTDRQRGRITKHRPQSSCQGAAFPKAKLWNNLILIARFQGKK